MQADIRAELVAQITDVRAELGTQVGGLRGEIGGLHAEIADLKSWVHGELRTQFYWTITLFVLLLGAYTAAMKLI